MSNDGPTVNASNQSQGSEIDLDRWARVATETLEAEHVGRGHLDLLFVDPDEMAELNRRHMGHEGPTDVLSFPLDGEDIDIDGTESDENAMPVLLGDVVICAQVAEEQAAGHCGDVQSELTLLVVHGVLHVLGHDHAGRDDSAAMVERETAHLARYRIAHPGPFSPESPQG